MVNPLHIWLRINTTHYIHLSYSDVPAKIVPLCIGNAEHSFEKTDGKNRTSS
jgi:hypothetical protein